MHCSGRTSGIKKVFGYFLVQFTDCCVVMCTCQNVEKPGRKGKAKEEKNFEQSHSLTPNRKSLCFAATFNLTFHFHFFFLAFRSQISV